MNPLVPLVIGFLLTTVLGGALGWYFQRQAWSHQFRVQSAAHDRERALAVFEEISRLLDKRLYRMYRLFNSLTDDTQQSQSDRVQTRLDEYVEVLFDWNDNINRNLALIHTYFGQRMRERFDNEVGKDMADAGASLDRLLHKTPEHRRDDPALESLFRVLAAQIYEFDLAMIEAIQAGMVGEKAPKPPPA